MSGARKMLKWLSHYCAFFLMVAFVITCCAMLFLRVLGNDLGITFTDENISAAAKITFWNVALLSLIFTVVDGIRRNLTVERPARQIAEAAERIVRGDFSARVDTRRFAADKNFNRVIESFNKMAQDLAGVETLRTDFVANVSHEMKTPLAVIQNYGTLLQDPGLSREQQLEYAQGVRDSACRMADMMTNILKLNRLENQQIFPQTAEYDLGEQLCECILEYESGWEKADIQLETDIAEDITVCADRELLGHVWGNLLSNAFKFTPRGGTVTVTLTATETTATVRVSDTGCGMSPEVGAHIFEKFYQGDTSHATRGNGLGLALVKRVVDILRGTITVESAVGKGSTFTVTINR